MEPSSAVSLQVGGEPSCPFPAPHKFSKARLRVRPCWPWVCGQVLSRARSLHTWRIPQWEDVMSLSLEDPRDGDHRSLEAGELPSIHQSLWALPPGTENQPCPLQPPVRATRSSKWPLILALPNALALPGSVPSPQPASLGPKLRTSEYKDKDKNEDKEDPATCPDLTTGAPESPTLPGIPKVDLALGWEGHQAFELNPACPNSRSTAPQDHLAISSSLNLSHVHSRGERAWNRGKGWGVKSCLPAQMALRIVLKNTQAQTPHEEDRNRDLQGPQRETLTIWLFTNKAGDPSPGVMRSGTKEREGGWP